MFGVSCCSQRGRECSNEVSAVDEGEECGVCDCWVADCEGCACCCMLRFYTIFVNDIDFEFFFFLLMRVAAGMVGLQFTLQLIRVIFHVWSFLLLATRM